MDKLPLSLRQISNPITAYDVLGYMAPGGTLILCIFLFEVWVERIRRMGLAADKDLHVPMYTAFTTFAGKLSNADWVLSALFLIVVLGIAYVVGHVVASLSALLMDRFYLAKAHGYPYEWLLDLKDDDGKSDSRSFYRGLFLWVNVVVVAAYLMVAHLGLPFVDLPVWAQWVTLGAIVAFIIFSSIVKWLVSTHRARDRNEDATDSVAEWAGRGEGWLTHVFSGPYRFIASRVKKLLFAGADFDDEFKSSYKEKYQRLFGYDPVTARSNNYWLSYIHIRQTSNELTRPIDNWLRLYSFARNLSTAFYASFLYAAVWFLAHGRPVAQDCYQLQLLRVIPVLFLIAAFAMLLRYFYLYTYYYTKFIFRAFVYLERVSPVSLPVTQRTES